MDGRGDVRDREARDTDCSNCAEIRTRILLEWGIEKKTWILETVEGTLQD